MDEKDKEIAELKATLATRDATIATMEKSIAEKDVLIDQKNNDLVGIRRENSRLAKLTEEEKSRMSEFEIKHHEALLQAQADNDKLRQEITERDKKEVESRRERIFGKFAGKDPELKAKLVDAFGKLKDSDKATTEEEIEATVNNAFSLIGAPRPDPIRSVINGDSGFTGAEYGASNFVDTEAGKGLASAMGLVVEAPKNNQ